MSDATALEADARSVAQANRDRAKEHLARFRDAPLGHFIDGRPTQGSAGESFEVLDPSTGQMLGRDSRRLRGRHRIRPPPPRRVPFAPGRGRSGDERRKLLHKIADAIVARADEIAFVESLDTGQPLRFMSKAALRGAENFRFFADRAPDAAERPVRCRRADHLNYTMRQPIGPVGVITPWNTPFMLSTWKIAPALAAGCTVVHKPAEWSPLQRAAAGRDRARGRASAGRLQRVNGFGEAPGNALTEHRDIKAIGFVGESSTGSAIMRAGRRDPEAHPFRARRQEPRHRVRRRRPRPRARCRGVHDLQPQRPALHLVEPLLVQSSIHDEFLGKRRRAGAAAAGRRPARPRRPKSAR